MYTYIEPMLYIDPQCERRFCFCEICGGECYAPEYFCVLCERRAS